MRHRVIVRRFPLLALGAFALIWSGCSVSVENSPAASRATDHGWDDPFADHDLVDLTHALSPDSLYWPNGSAFEYERLLWGAGEDGAWYAMGAFATPEHLGTHLDAPIHFAEAGWTNSDIAIDRFFAPAVVVDISGRAATDPDTTLQANDVDAWVEEFGPIPDAAIVLVRTGWADKWPDWNGYYGSADPFDTNTLHFPGVSAAGAARIVAAGAVGVGIDTASIDPGNDLAFEAHRVLGEAQLFNLENLMNLDALPAAGAYLVALPAKIAGGSGAPARVIALVPRE
jgi:kynurenine formamidase